MARYLADTSIWSWAAGSKRPDIRAKLAERFERGELVTCAPVIIEALHGSRTDVEYRERYAQLFAPLDRLPLGDEVAERALVVQQQMAQVKHGNHRRPAIDYLIAALAEAAGDQVVLWAFDRDLRVISQHTGQPYEAEKSVGPGR